MTKGLTLVFLMLAILMEVAGTTAMKISDNFTFWLPSLLIFVFYFFAFVFLALSLKRLELGKAYALWSGLGTLLIAVIGAFFFGEPMNLLKVASLGLIVIGVVGLRIT